MNGVEYTNGMVIDVYPEGESVFRGCVKRTEIISGKKYIVTINSRTGEVCLNSSHECGSPVIENIFTVDSQ